MKEKLIALTFDDGPNGSATVGVLDRLEEYGVTASFFVVGDNIRDDGIASLCRAAKMGCEIGNHSKTHSDMTKLGIDEIRSEILYTSDMVKKLTGLMPRFFRPPYIAVNEAVIDGAALPLIAGCGAEDWLDSVSAEERARRIIDGASDGGIILLHDMECNHKTVTALDTIIPALLDDGYGFVTVSELFFRAGVTPIRGRVYSNVYQTTDY